MKTSINQTTSTLLGAGTLLKSVAQQKTKQWKTKFAKEKTDKAFCYDSLNKVSRSFALVIQQLPEELKDAIAVFYLVLRALDSIEDDMSVEENFKNQTLKTFYLKCTNASYCLMNIGENENEVELLEQYYRVARFMQSLKPAYQKAITHTTKLMGEGMANFAQKEIKTKAEYDKYCYYVAGLVGIGLSELFSASNLENESIKDQKTLANAMGLLLQKTNITRDYQEDIYAERFFWPNEIWEKYATKKTFFVENPSHQKSLDCLNEMCINALQHLAQVIEYLNLIQDEKIFRFCAIPQIMAVATLSELYNNSNALQKIVKIERSLTMEIFGAVKNKQDFNRYCKQFIQNIQAKNERTSIHFETLNQLLNKVNF